MAAKKQKKILPKRPQQVVKPLKEKEESKEINQKSQYQRSSFASRPLLPGTWQSNALIFALIVVAATLLYSGDLHLGFFNLDDPGYVTNDPWIKKINGENIIHILTVPYFANYSPFHLLSYSLDWAIAGNDPFVFHLSSNIWAAIVAGFVFLAGLALTGSRIVAIAAAILFMVHPAHVEAIVWISSRKDLVAAAFALPSLLAYLKYRKEQKVNWYIISIVLFLFAILGKLSVATFAAVFFAHDVFVEKRPVVKSLVDKIPYVAMAIIIAFAVASAQPISGNRPDPYVYFIALCQSLWLLTGFGTYVIYRVPPLRTGRTQPLQSDQYRIGNSGNDHVDCHLHGSFAAQATLAARGGLDLLDFVRMDPCAGAVICSSCYGSLPVFSICGLDHTNSLVTLDGNKKMADSRYGHRRHRIVDHYAVLAAHNTKISCGMARSALGVVRCHK